MMNFNNYSPLKDMPVCLPEAVAYYHKIAAETQTKAERGYTPVFNMIADRLSEERTSGLLPTLASLGDLIGGAVNITAYRLTKSRREKEKQALQQDRLHDLVDPMVKLNVIRAIALDAEARGIDFKELPCIQSGDFKRVLRYATARAQHIGVAHPQPEQPQP